MSDTVIMMVCYGGGNHGQWVDCQSPNLVNKIYISQSQQHSGIFGSWLERQQPVEMQYIPSGPRSGGSEEERTED